MLKTVFKKFKVIWSAKAVHIISNFLKAVFHKLYFVYSWIAWTNIAQEFQINVILTKESLKLTLWKGNCSFEYDAAFSLVTYQISSKKDGYTKRQCTKYKLLLTSIFSTSPFSITIWVFVILTKKMSFRNYIQRGIFGLQIALRSLIDDF